MARPESHRFLIAPLLLLALAGCGTPGPRPLELGTESCAHCHMTLADPRFTAELVTRTGRVIPFDDPGCLAAFVATQGIPTTEIQSLWVSDFLTHELREVSQEIFLRSEAIHSPMDYQLVALHPGNPADSLRSALGGQLLSWDSVLTVVRSAHPH